MEPALLKWLYFDLDSYFASAEQHLQAELRGKPIAVVPMMSDATCAIAASYEAKKFGIKTGTKIYKAKELCPELICVAARPKQYVQLHHQIFNLINKYLSVDHVYSIDEGACKLTGDFQNEENILAIISTIKKAIKEEIGESITCSIGIGPNKFIAKIASNLQKPNGARLIHSRQIEEILSSLQLKDLPGIGRSMERRLNHHNIYSVKELYLLSEERLALIWGSVVGRRYWYLLKGIDLPSEETKRSSISQSKILIQEEKLASNARKVILRLLLKAAFRLREKQLYAARISLKIKNLSNQSFKQKLKIPLTNDSLNLSKYLLNIWDHLVKEYKIKYIKKVALVLFDLSPETGQLNMFEQQNYKKKKDLSKVLDTINNKFGTNTISIGLVNLKKQEEDPIAFGGNLKRENSRNKAGSKKNSK